MNLFKLLETNLRITNIVICLLVIALILIPKIAEVTKKFSNLVNEDLSTNDRNYLISEQENISHQNLYVPPNYGGPDSQHGSGTR